MSHWVYSAIIVAIASAVLGLTVSLLIIRRVYLGHHPRPVISLLLISLLGLSVAQAFEQTRVLLFRSSFDGIIDRGIFFEIYNSTWNVAATKVLLAVSLSTAAALKLGLYCDKPDETILKWSITGAAAAVLGWIVLSVVVDVLI